jgi:hypothetical protein
VTEAEWLGCTDPTPMLTFFSRKMSRRKVWLFALACCRRTRSPLRVPESRSLIEQAETVVDEPEVEPVLRSAWEKWIRKPTSTPAAWKGIVTQAADPGRRGYNRGSAARVARDAAAASARPPHGVSIQVANVVWCVAAEGGTSCVGRRSEKLFDFADWQSLTVSE